MSKFDIRVMRSSASDLYDYITPDGIICEAEIFEVATIEKDADPLSEKILPYYIELTGKYQGVYFYDYMPIQSDLRGMLEPTEEQLQWNKQKDKEEKRQVEDLRRWFEKERLPEKTTEELYKICFSPSRDLDLPMKGPFMRTEGLEAACGASPNRFTSDNSVKIRVKVEELEGELIITEYLPFREEEDSKVDLDGLAKGIQSGDINPPGLTLPEEMKLSPAYLSRIASKYDIDTLASDDSKKLKQLADHVRKNGGVSQLGSSTADIQDKDKALREKVMAEAREKGYTGTYEKLMEQSGLKELSMAEVRKNGFTGTYEELMKKSLIITGACEKCGHTQPYGNGVK